ncbi:MAG TPA: hypothetical protein PLU22_01260 [Polyangiaceae bacterium]|nr:hypothetical protein [Polyangiaceae bacterium]
MLVVARRILTLPRRAGERGRRRVARAGLFGPGARTVAPGRAAAARSRQAAGPLAEPAWDRRKLGRFLPES